MRKTKTEIATIVYNQFYELLEKTAQLKLEEANKAKLEKLSATGTSDQITSMQKKYQEEKGLTREKLWKAIKENGELYNELFKGKKRDAAYFLNKCSEMGKSPDYPMSIDIVNFCDALQFIGYDIPEPKQEHKKKEDLLYSKRLELWAPEFLKKYFSEDPNHDLYLMMLLSNAIIKKENRELGKGVLKIDEPLLKPASEKTFIDKTSLHRSRYPVHSAAFSVFYRNLVGKIIEREFPDIAKGSLLSRKMWETRIDKNPTTVFQKYFSGSSAKDPSYFYRLFVELRHTPVIRVDTLSLYKGLSYLGFNNLSPEATRGQLFSKEVDKMMENFYLKFKDEIAHEYYKASSN